MLVTLRHQARKAHHKSAVCHVQHRDLGQENGGTQGECGTAKKEDARYAR